MDIAELIEIAVAGAEKGRVEVAALEPAEVALEAVSGLSQLVAELVDNAAAFSDPDDQIRVTGLFEERHYLISISDRGVGIPEHLMAGLNAVLDDPAAAVAPEPNLGIALVARLAARLGVAVRLVPGVPGTTARVTVPPRLVGAAEETGHKAPEGVREHRLLKDLEEAISTASQPSQPDPDRTETTVDLTSLERSIRSRRGVVAMSDEARREAESFLEKVFGPLMGRPGKSERPSARPASNGGGEASAPPDRPAGRPEAGQGTVPDVGPDTGGTVTELRVRVPGVNFSLSEDDPSTVAAERAIDIRSALSKYAQGRRSAQESSGEGGPNPAG
ncbi:MAG TPA: ATP-binding protein [Acidimicrobiia bacterium]|nr:ATP-binding protein [Acidimicrobiia bacterium]